MIIKWEKQFVDYSATLNRNEVNLVFTADGGHEVYEFHLEKCNVKWLRKALKQATYLMELNKDETN